MTGLPYSQGSLPCSRAHQHCLGKDLANYPKQFYTASRLFWNAGCTSVGHLDKKTTTKTHYQHHIVNRNTHTLYTIITSPVFKRSCKAPRLIIYTRTHVLTGLYFCTSLSLLMTERLLPGSIFRISHMTPDLLPDQKEQFDTWRGKYNYSLCCLESR